MVNRCALFHKMYKYNIKGPFLNILKDMYASLSCCVKTQSGLGASFETKIGVKQGCILSPTLFSIYLNDLNSFFDNSCDPVTVDNTYVSSLLYADDIVLISKTATGLQSAMNKLGDFCLSWNLSVNISKTKVIIFNKSGRVLKGFSFKYMQTEVEIVQEYNYLGIIFRASGVFTQAIKYLCNKALKATFSIKKALAGENMNTDLYLKVYEHCVKPILLYCSEVLSLDFIVNKDNLISFEHRYDLLQQEKIERNRSWV